MTAMVARYTAKRLALVETLDSADVGSSGGPVYARAIGVDSLNRIWIGAWDPSGAETVIRVYEPVRGQLEATGSASLQFHGQMAFDLNARMWVASVDGRVRAINVLLVDEGGPTGYTDETRGLLFDPGADRVYVSRIDPGTGAVRLSEIDPTPGAEVTTATGASVGGIGIGNRGDMSPVRDEAGYFYFGDIDTNVSYVRCDVTTLAASRVVLSTPNNCGIGAVDHAFGWLWLGGDSIDGVGVPPPMLQKVQASTGAVRASLTFDDAVAIRGITHDDRWIYVSLDKDPGGGVAECTVVQIDPVTLGIKQERRFNIITAVAPGGAGPMVSHNGTPFSLPTPVLASALLWVDSSDKRLVSGYRDRRRVGTTWSENAFADQPAGGTNAYINDPTPDQKRRVGPATAGAGAVFAKVGTRPTRAFGGGARNAAATQETLKAYPGYTAVPLAENTYLHDTVASTLAFVFRPIDATDKTLFSTLSDPTLTNSRGIWVGWVAANQSLRIRITNGGGVAYVVDMETFAGSFPRGRTASVVFTYDPTGPTFRISWRGSDAYGARLNLEYLDSAGTGQTPSGLAPDTALLTNCNLGFLFEYAGWDRLLNEFELYELFNYLGGRWHVPFDPGLIPDLELWLRADKAGTETFTSLGTVYLSLLPNEGIGSGITGTAWNVPQPFAPAGGEEPAYATLVGSKQGLYFDSSRPSRIDARQDASQFRWLHGGGAPGGGIIAGMTLAWSMKGAGTGTTQTLFSTGTNQAAFRGLTITRNAVTNALTVHISNGAVTIASLSTTISANTISVVVRALFTGGNTTIEIWVDGVLVAGPSVLAFAASDADPIGALRIGGRVGSSGVEYDGFINEVVGARRALTDEEIASLTHYLDWWKLA